MANHESQREEGRKPNRLITEHSPYLRQHAYNPVDWYPWGEEALAQAKALNKPILLSIGYSACHWCHVMERESFENAEIARLMNENFVPIKVDREERPDLDQIYMDAVQLMRGQGGWPLTVFLTPEGQPFFGGTYFPPEDSRGMPGFRRILLAITEHYRNKPEDVAKNVGQLSSALASMASYQKPENCLQVPDPMAAAQSLSTQYDNVHGGLGGAPKFPNTFVFSLFLRVFQAGEGPVYGDMVAHTLTMMAKGGIYDQIGGGFHRYSVDQRWTVPHFEKMLYDNALLARLYLDAARALDRPPFLDIAREVLDYVLREMTSSEGGFYSSQDADSEGEEGKFFIWSAEEARSAAGEDLFPLAARYFDISAEGNFEGGNVLRRTLELADTAMLFKMTEEKAAAAISKIRKRLFEARERRVKPGRDEKILTAWNSLMISAMAEGYRALGDTRYLEAAQRAADFIMRVMWDGRALRRSYKDGVARFNAYLEDYALAACAFIDIYEASLERRYLEHARDLAQILLERFLDRENGGFFFTSDDHERLIVRPKNAFDGSVPSGNSSAIMALMRLSEYYSTEDRYMREAERAIKLFASFMSKQPFAFAHMLEAVDLYQRGATEIVIVGNCESSELQHWLGRLGMLYIPNRAIFAADPADESKGVAVPEQVRGKVTAANSITGYVCRNRACSLPRTSIDDLVAELRG